MLRTLLRPRWLGLTGLLVLTLAACTVLGLWQLSVAKDDARKAAVEQAPREPLAAIGTVLTPQRPFPATASGRRVVATGRYDATGQVLVAGRRLNGVSGLWVLTPLVVDETGARIAVLRGFVRSAADATPPTTSGEVTVVGSVAPGESPVSSGAPFPAGQLGSADLAQLVNAWHGEIYNAFLFAISEAPDATGAGPSGSSAEGAIERVPPPQVPSGLTLRNAAYAVQWWVFGLFAVWIWWRMVREDHEQDVARDEVRPDPAPDPNRAPAGVPRP